MGIQKLNNPEWPWLALDDLQMTLENIILSAGPSFNHISPQNRMKMKNLLLYDFELGTIEYIYANISMQKVQKWKYFV